MREHTTPNDNVSTISKKKHQYYTRITRLRAMYGLYIDTYSYVNFITVS